MVAIIDGVVDGGPLTLPYIDQSCGPFLHEIMNKLPSEDEAHTNADTGEVMTNGQFLKMCETIAVGLQSIGVQQGDMIVVMGKNTFRISATVIACLFIAAPVGALDENLKSVEIKNLLQYFEPKIIFCNRRQVKDTLISLEALKFSNTMVILLDEDERKPADDPRLSAFPAVLSSETEHFLPNSVNNNGEKIALVIPSSGSTGLSKGVAISHRSIVISLQRWNSSDQQKTEEQFLQLSHLYWISGMMALLRSCMGMHRIFLSDESDVNLLRAIKKYKPNSIFLAPSMVTAMLEHRDFKSDDVSSLKCIVTGGTLLTELLITEMKKKMPNALHVHIYGSTEVCGRVTKCCPSTDDITCVGIVEAGVKLKIVAPETRNTLPIGEKGEICVKVPTMMIGYIGNAEATKAVINDEGWFYTGDMGYLNHDGFLYFSGRLNQLIKYRNHKISPEEIEGCLITMPGVVDCGVVGIPNEQDQFHAMGLVVKHHQSTLNEHEICEYVKKNMSEAYQLHGGVRFVTSIPRTRTAAKKVRRHELQKLALRVLS